MEDQEIIREFLIESNESLARLDQDMVELEKTPDDAGRLASVFRTIHTIKGTCGFLGFGTLESVSHVAENLLSQLRNGEKRLTPEIVNLILSTVDAARTMLASIEENGSEGEDQFQDLRARLQAACERKAAPQPSQPEAAPAPQKPAASPSIPQPAAEVRAPVSPPEPVEPAESSADASKAAPPKQSAITDSAIRVDVGLLDKLMRLVGELVLTRNQILQDARQEDSTLQRLNLITSELQESVMRTRMQPIGVVWNKLPRVVRDLAHTCGKQIELDLEGADTELDRTIIEAIKDPLTHIVRNACDHGLEPPDVRLAHGKTAAGRLSLRAFHEGGHVNIEVTDDGAGVDGDKVRRKAVSKGLLRQDQADALTDREATNLLFLPGFSTAEKVTNISGRGVGMDVVKTNIGKIGGTIELTSQKGHGTKVRIKIPLTLAIIPGLIVHSGGERFVIPQVSLVELVRLEGEVRQRSIDHFYGGAVFRRRGELLPLLRLHEVLGLTAREIDPDAINIVIVQAGERQFGLAVDAISDTQEIVVKPLGKQLKSTTCYAGATIMGDGRVALILDVAGIATMSDIVNPSGERDFGSGHTDQDSAIDDRQAFLLFRAGRYGRLAMPLALVARLEEIPVSRLERAGDRHVVQYRDEILPLVSMSEALEGYTPEFSPEAALPTIVVSNGTRSIGLAVDEILDIAEDRLTHVRPGGRPPLAGSAVIGGLVTDLLDVQSAVEAFEPGWFSAKPARTRGTVLVVDPAPFSRVLLRGSAELAGYRVCEAASSAEMRALLRRTRIDAIVLAGEACRGGGSMLDCTDDNELLQSVPVIAMGEFDGSHPRVCAKHGKLDREAMLASLHALMQAVEEETRVGASR